LEGDREGEWKARKERGKNRRKKGGMEGLKGLGSIERKRGR
jgi:hypothetical protein